MKHLLSVWPEVLEQIQKSKKILFLSDFDGTLTPIVEKPELANIAPDMLQLVSMLSGQPRITVGIISGRALADLKSKFNLEGLIYAGNHGFEIEGPGLKFINPLTDEIKPFFRIVRQVLTLTLSSIKGVFIEDKGITLSVHYRQVEDRKADEVEKIVNRVVNGPLTRRFFKVIPGKKVYDVKPASNWDKGKAVRLLMKRFGKGGRQSGLFPIYIGDDLTDEDAFKVIEKYGSGISIYVGDHPEGSVAGYYLRAPDEVGTFMSKLLDCAQRGIVCEQFSTI